MKDTEDIVFMIPGPVKIHPRVVRSMTTPVINHRGAEFKEVNAELLQLTKYLFQTSGEVCILSGSGTAGLEGAVSSLLRKEDKVLNIVSGKFGERFYDISKIFAEPTRLDLPWGRALDLDRIAEELERDDYRAVTFCHNETSTATTNQAKELAGLARKRDAFVIMDGITSVGGIETRIDEWGIDVTVVGSQKCVAAPAGLAIVAVSKRAYDELHDSGSYYTKLKKHIDELRDESNTPYTPAIPLFLALREALRMLKEEGLENRINRTARLAEACRSAVEGLGLELFAEREVASNTVTAINYPADVEDGKFRKILRDEYRVIVAGGQAQLKGKIFRIGHMGICSMSDLAATFAAVEATLAKMGCKFRRGAGVSAIAEAM